MYQWVLFQSEQSWPSYFLEVKETTNGSTVILRGRVHCTVQSCARGLYLIQLLRYINEMCGPVVIFEDNQGAISLSKIPVNQQRSQYIDIHYHFIQTVQRTGKVVVKYCTTADMAAELTTKAATKFKLQKFRCYIFK